MHCTLRLRIEQIIESFVECTMAVAEVVNERIDITEVVQVSSYSWLNFQNPTIIVPGE